MKTYNYSLVLLMVAGSLQGCAQSRIEKDLDAKVAQETEVKTHADLRQESIDRINGAVGLTADQRSRLMILRKATAKKMDELNNESLRLRSLLVKDLVATDYNADEVDLIKKRIQKIEKQKISNIFDAADQANQILGHDTRNSTMVLNDIFAEPRGHLN